MNHEHALQSVFMYLFRPFGIDPGLPRECWAELKNRYEEKNRQYHTLDHLQHMYEVLYPLKEHIEDWTAILLALFYHDSIYSTSSSDNEEQSAELAGTRLHTARIPQEHIDRCLRHILATKKHHWSEDADTNLFTDSAKICSPG